MGNIRMEIVWHLYKSNCMKSSRVKFQEYLADQLNVESRFIDTRNSNGYNYKLNFFNLNKVVLLSNSQTKIIFHAQSSLVYLLYTVILKYITLRKLRLVYDVHDVINLKEEQKKIATRSRWKRLLLLKIERLIFNLRDVHIITVSKGLSKFIKRQSGVSPLVVYNVSIPPVLDEFSQNLVITKTASEKKRQRDLSNSLKSKRFVFFGRKGRFPAEFFDILDGDLDVYSDDITEDWILNMFGENIASRVKLKGPYSPENLQFLRDYDVLVLINSDYNGINFRYSMPNKIFQSIYFGLDLFVSDNYIEILKSFPSDNISLLKNANIKLANDTSRKYYLITNKDPVEFIDQHFCVSKSNFEKALRD